MQIKLLLHTYTKGETVPCLNFQHVAYINAKLPTLIKISQRITTVTVYTNTPEETASNKRKCAT